MVWQAETVAVLWILLRFGAAIVAVIQLTTARERDLSIKWFLDVRAIVFQATSRALGLDVDGPDLVNQATITSRRQQPAGNMVTPSSGADGEHTIQTAARAATAEALPPHLNTRSSASIGLGEAP